MQEEEIVVRGRIPEKGKILAAANTYMFTMR